ncbi:MAG: ABC transporter permease, partial [Pyrinomonadaceae bacterium]
MALSLVVLVCAGLFVKSFRNAQATDPGFEAENVLAMSLDPGLFGYTDDQTTEFYRQLTGRVEGLPGVESASVARLLPLGDSSNSTGPVIAEGREPPRDGAGRSVLYNVVGPGHFGTLRIPLVEGRDFSERDDRSAPRVVIVNETLARQLWPGLKSVVGQRLRIGSDPSAPPREVVGVARNGRYRSLGERPRPYLYFPHRQRGDSGMTLLVRAGGDPRGLAGAVRQEVQSLDKRLPVYGVKTMKEHMTWALWGTRMAAALSLTFGVLALLLAAAGVYGVMSYSVARRTREIGIRMALGAQKRDVLRLIAGQGMTLALVGVGAGLVAALVVTRVLSSLL